MHVFGRKKMLLRIWKRHAEDVYLLREAEAAYSAYFEAEKVGLSMENTVYFDINAEESA